MTDTHNGHFSPPGPTDASDQSFQAAVLSASEITIYWCPVVKRSNYTRSREEESNQTRSPEEDRVWTDEICEEAAGELRTALLTLGTAKEPGSLRAAALQLAAAGERPRVEVSLREILQAAVAEGWFDRGTETINNGRGKLPDRGSLVDYVAYADRSLPADGSGPGRVSAFLFGEPPLSCRCSLGLYEEDKVDRPSWSPDINVVATYDGAGLQAALQASRLSLLGFLKHYCRRMFQKSVYVLLPLPGAGVQAWLYEYDHVADAGGVTPLVETNTWMLRQTTPAGWLRQFSMFWRQLSLGWDSRREKIRNEMKEMKRISGTRRGFVGATIEQVLDDQGAMRVVVSGRGRFLFEASFPPALLADDDARIKDVPELILLHTEEQGSERAILYAPYTEDPGVANRCLCGWHYPGTEHDQCDTATHGVVRHRIGQAPWVDEALRDHRGSGWDWRLLSSPHFYHSAEPEKLRADAPEETQQEEDRSAVANTQAEWARLMSTFFCE